MPGSAFSHATGLAQPALAAGSFAAATDMAQVSTIVTVTASSRQAGLCAAGDEAMRQRAAAARRLALPGIRLGAHHLDGERATRTG